MLVLSSSPFSNSLILCKQSPSKNVKTHVSHLSREEEEEEHIFFLDSGSAVRTLNSCTAQRNLKLGTSFHANTLKSGLYANVFVSNSLIDLYAKCGRQVDAAQLFDKMTERTVVSWTAMLTSHFQNGEFFQGFSIFLRMLEDVKPNERTLAVLLRACAQMGDQNVVQVIHCYAVKHGFFTEQFLQNSLLNAYVKSGSLDSAIGIMERLSYRDVVAWTSIISGCVNNGLGKEALNFFFQMQEDGVIPNAVTILSILQACSMINKLWIFKWIHGLIVKTELCGDALVMNSLVELYSVNGHFLEGVKILHELNSIEGDFLSSETMAILLQGCCHSGYWRLGEQIHGLLRKLGSFPCTVIGNSLIDMYGQNGQISSAFQLFGAMIDKDVVSWNTMITCLVKNDQFSEALELLHEIHSKGDTVFPDFITMLSSIQACSNLSPQFGQVIHGYITRAGMVSDIFIQNALIDMYGKSGRLDLAKRMFDEMPERDLGSWNSMISAYGINGDGASALHAFTELDNLGTLQPNSITFVNILFACSHSGLVKEGLKIFDSMERRYGVALSMEHFASIVDLLGRSGRLGEAKAFIGEISSTPGPAVWAALLGACAVFGDVKVAERAAMELSILEPESEVWRVAMGNVYARAGRWEDAAKVRKGLRGREGLRKDGGWSCVELRGDMYRFMVGDTRHPESKDIYKLLNRLQKHIRDDSPC